MISDNKLCEIITQCYNKPKQILFLGTPAFTAKPPRASTGGTSCITR